MKYQSNKDILDYNNNNKITTNNNKITIKNVNINTLSNYQKIFNNDMTNNSNIQEEINKIFNINIQKTINKDSGRKNNINLVKVNNKEQNLNIQNIKSLNKQYSFKSIQSNEVENEIRDCSFLSESSEKNEN